MPQCLLTAISPSVQSMREGPWANTGPCAEDRAYAPSCGTPGWCRNAIPPRTDMFL